jgi:hypothetical protein
MSGNGIDDVFGQLEAYQKAEIERLENEVVELRTKLEVDRRLEAMKRGARALGDEREGEVRVHPGSDRARAVEPGRDGRLHEAPLQVTPNATVAGKTTAADRRR